MRVLLSANVHVVMSILKLMYTCAYRLELRKRSVEKTLTAPVGERRKHVPHVPPVISVYVCVCVFVCERESVCVSVCVWVCVSEGGERERERQIVCMRTRKHVCA